MDLTNIKIHAKPVRVELPTGNFIIGVTPVLAYSPELLSELQVEYESRKNSLQNEMTEDLGKTQTYEVASKSNPEKKYIVEVDERGIRCDCKGFMFRKNCSHCEDIRKKIKKNG